MLTNSSKAAPLMVVQHPHSAEMSADSPRQKPPCFFNIADRMLKAGLE